MIYILSNFASESKQDNGMRVQQLFARQNIQSRLISFGLLRNSIAIETQWDFANGSICSVFDLLTGRDIAREKVNGLSLLGVNDSYRLEKTRTHIYYYIKEELGEKLEVTFYDYTQSTIKDVSYFQNEVLQKKYEFNERGQFVSIKYPTDEANVYIREILCPDGSTAFRIKQTDYTVYSGEVVKEDLSFDNGEDFYAYLFERLITKLGTDGNKFIICDSVRINRAFLKNLNIPKTNIYYMPDYPLDVIKKWGVSDTVFMQDRYQGVILNSVKEKDLYEEQYAKKSNTQFFWNNHGVVEDWDNQSLSVKTMMCVISLGSMDNYKEEDIQLVAKQLIYVIQANPNIELKIECSFSQKYTELKAALSQHLAESEWSERIKLQGYLPRALMKNLLSEARCYINLDTAANVDIVLFDALACSLPAAVLAESPSADQYVTGGSGLIIQLSHLSDAVLSFCESRAFYLKRYAAIEKIREEYDSLNTAKRWKEILEID